MRSRQTLGDGTARLSTPGLILIYMFIRLSSALSDSFLLRLHLALLLGSSVLQVPGHRRINLGAGELEQSSEVARSSEVLATLEDPCETRDEEDDAEYRDGVCERKGLAHAEGPPRRSAHNSYSQRWQGTQGGR